MSILGDNLGRRARQSRFNPIRSLTPATLSSALDSFDIGYLRSAALLWEIIEDRDDVLQIVGPKRRKRASRRPWQVLATDDSAAAKQHVETITDFLNNLTATEAADENVKGGLRLLLRQMMNAPFHKYAAHEIVWSTVGGKLRAELRFVPLYFFSNTAGRLGYIGPEGAGVDGVPLDDKGWMITTGDSALMKAASIWRISSCASRERTLATDCLAMTSRTRRFTSSRRRRSSGGFTAASRASTWPFSQLSSRLKALMFSRTRCNKSSRAVLISACSSETSDRRWLKSPSAPWMMR